MRCAGYLTGDQRVAFCSREEKAGSLQVAGDSNCFPHRLEGRCGCGTVHGDAPPPPPRRAVRDTRVWRPVAHYDYHDRDGNVRFQVVRLEPDPQDGDKRFTQRRIDPGKPGRWIEGQGAMEGVQLLPYRLPDLLRDPKRLILIVEGEKAVDALRARGLPATTCPMGAGKWWDSGHDCPRTELTSWMLADVAGRGDNRLPVVIGDNDDAGRRGAEATCRALAASGLDPQLLELVGVPEHGGADDWIDQDPTRTARDLIAQLPAGQRWLDLHPSEAEGQEPEGGGNGNGNGNGHNGNGHEDGHALPEFSDTRNAERFAARHGKGARFDHTRGLWRLYTGTRWRLDATEQCMTLAKDVVAHLPEEVPEWCDDPKARYRLHREILACESTMRLRALLANAQSRLHSTHETWDPDPWLLNCENGTVDLHTGQLHPHKPDEMQSKLAPVDYVPGAECPRWDAFLGRIFEHDPELIAFVQRAIGLTLIGTVLEHVLFVCYGRGANGKGTFIRALSALLGDYARATNPHLLTETKVPQHLTAIAELQGIRMATTSEQEGGFSERLAKMLTGGDRRNANFMFHDHFTYMPADTFWLETNHKPLITGNSEGIWRRLRLIPFSVQIPDDEQVPRYEDVLLREEAPGILRWCIDGCLAYQRQGLGQSPAVERATRQYRTEMDSMAAFLDQETVQAEADSVSAAVLFHRYKEWCEGSGERPTSQRFLGLRLSERGLASFRSAHDGNRTHWRGLRLRLTGEQLALPPGEDSLLADCQAVCRALWAEGADARELCSLILQTHGWEREGQPSAWLQAQDRDVLEAILPDAQTSLAEVRQQRGR
jgi:P4 family phage/plasmid primase-like protien